MKEIKDNMKGCLIGNWKTERIELAEHVGLNTLINHFR